MKYATKYNHAIHSGAVYVVDGQLTTDRPGGDYSDARPAGWWRAHPDTCTAFLEFRGWRAVVEGGEPVAGFAVSQVPFPGAESPSDLRDRVVAALVADPRAVHDLNLSESAQ